MLADQQVLVGQQFRSVRFGGEVADSQFGRLTFPSAERLAAELGLQTLLRLRKQAEIRSLRGKLDWQGDLDAMRTDR